MKHLRKAFAHHRFIRRGPEASRVPNEPQTTPNATTAAHEAARVSPPWSRYKPAFTTEPDTPPGFITLWDETDRMTQHPDTTPSA
ncbi:hypothetical protein [Marinobacterium marinum]|uniref:Uncharacterized protein n=1 Tax=Marinobacterium marinum TaxID=2756129 RepID=A0A7W1WWW7_9GAMM|nr:hypothetical protein [Marinobacterium marinum]MBA4501546.1 hypothetical protein [Marinobacterium marinum]